MSRMASAISGAVSSESQTSLAGEEALVEEGEAASVAVERPEDVIGRHPGPRARSGGRRRAARTTSAAPPPRGSATGTQRAVGLDADRVDAPDLLALPDLVAHLPQLPRSTPSSKRPRSIWIASGRSCWWKRGAATASSSDWPRSGCGEGPAGSSSGSSSLRVCPRRGRAFRRPWRSKGTSRRASVCRGRPRSLLPARGRRGWARRAASRSRPSRCSTGIPGPARRGRCRRNR